MKSLEVHSNRKSSSLPEDINSPKEIHSFFLDSILKFTHNIV